ncbi:NTP transferase domain-containing protein [Candidatus Woesearchaeota archaeon]|nr:NTP transferase domain-containing protein [Candidatus Woesearchaeota archaeon]
MKARFSITLSPDLQQQLDALIDSVHIRSRSEAIEKIVRKYLEHSKKAVILCGGNPEHYKINGFFRPLVLIKGKPLISYTLAALKHAGFHHIHVVGSAPVVGEIFKTIGNGHDHGVKIEYTEESHALGQFKTLQAIEDKLTTPFLIIQMDNFFTFNPLLIHKTFVENKAIVSLALHARDDATNKKGFVEVSGDVITHFSHEQNGINTSIASCTLAMCDPAIFRFIPREESPCGDEHLFPQLIKSRQLRSVMIKGPWFNIHTAKDVQKVEEWLEEHEFPYAIAETSSQETTGRMAASVA